MPLLIPVILLLAASLALIILRLLRPRFRFSWLIAVGTAFVAWLSVLLWRLFIPISLGLGQWAPSGLLISPPLLSADQFSWLYSLSLMTLALATLLTATVREGFPDVLRMAAVLTACGLGVLAVTAGNPLTLALIWAGLDLAELITMLSSESGREAGQRVITAFSVHAAAILILMLAQVTGAAGHASVDFSSLSPQAGALLLVAAGLRLGVIPLHLPFVLGSSLRRGIGTTIRLVSAASSLILLSRVPTASLPTLFAVLFFLIAAFAAVYAGWMWLRAPDELSGRPFWIVGLAGLAMFSALRGSPEGAAAWGTAVILAGAALFLSSIQHTWLNRLLFLGAWTISALPFSLTAVGWNGTAGLLDLLVPAFVIAQALLMAGFVRHSLRPSSRLSLQSQPAWTRSVYPAGIGLLMMVQLLFGVWGWDGALRLGALFPAITAALLTAALVWAVPRLPILNPVPAHWLRAGSGTLLDTLLRGSLGLYRWIGGLGQTVTDVLEGDAGLMWTLLFLVLFVLLIVQRKP